MDSSDFPDWLDDQLRTKRMTQSELARRSGVSRQTISDYVNRKRPNPDERALIKIARVLGVSENEIFRAAGLLPDLPTRDAARKEIVDNKLKDLTSAEMEDVLRYIDFITQRRESQDQTEQTSKTRRQGERPGEVVKEDN